MYSEIVDAVRREEVSEIEPDFENEFEDEIAEYESVGEYENE